MPALTTKEISLHSKAVPNLTIKNAATDHPILKLLAERWSPYGFEDRSVPEGDLRSLFEAARWAASSYNEQPWNYLVATKDDPVEFGRLLGCLVAANQAWAKTAPVLVLGVVSLQFAQNKQDKFVFTGRWGQSSPLGLKRDP